MTNEATSGSARAHDSQPPVLTVHPLVFARVGISVGFWVLLMTMWIFTVAMAPQWAASEGQAVFSMIASTVMTFVLFLVIYRVRDSIARSWLGRNQYVGENIAIELPGVEAGFHIVIFASAVWIGLFGLGALTNWAFPVPAEAESIARSPAAELALGLASLVIAAVLWLGAPRIANGWCRKSGVTSPGADAGAESQS